MGDPVSLFERYLEADRRARTGPPEHRPAAKAQADRLFRDWQRYPRDVRQRVEEHFKPGCTRVGSAPVLPGCADATLRDLAAAAYDHPYNSADHQRNWLVALDYEQEHCPDEGKDYPLHRNVCERLIARLTR